MIFLQHLRNSIPNDHPLRLLWHRGKAFLAALLFGFPARHLTVIGITGTDGKTTTVGMVAHVLQKAGHSVSALSTAFFRIQDDITWNATQKTSPSPFVVQRFLRKSVRKGCTHAVLEYSSHGLIQGRTLYTWPAVAAITNLAEEHLDYHGTIDAYMQAKQKLFAMLKGRGTKVLNGNDRTYECLRSVPSGTTIVFGTGGTVQDTRLWASTIRLGPSVSALLHLQHPGGAQENQSLHLLLPGAFNVDNALCAMGCCLACGVQLTTAIAALRTFTGIPGRMERIDEGQPFTVYVDFTVTPQSYEKTLSTIRDGMEEGTRLLVLTGSCGDRMKAKRPIVGHIVSSFADVTVVTNEDPYTEDPEKIIDEVWAGVDRDLTEAYRIVDRGEAIRFLLSQARPGDSVLLCGKGSDTTMMTAIGQIPWNEREIVRATLREMQEKHAVSSRV